MKTKLTTLFIDFFESEKTSGIILILCTIASITIANSNIGADYLNLWHTTVAIGIGDTFSLKYSLEHWINDGLMTVFFLLIGLEIERELYIGELSTPKNASLPIIAAFGGMVVPTSCLTVELQPEAVPVSRWQRILLLHSGYFCCAPI